MGLINIHDGIALENYNIKGNGRLCDLIPNFNFENAIILKEGVRIPPEYNVEENDIIFLRVIPAGVTATVATVIATGFVVLAGVLAGSAISSIVNKVNKEQAEKAQRDANNLAQQINQLPFLKGARNKCALGNLIQYQIGRMYNTPYLINDGFMTLSGNYGENQYYNAVLTLGYGDLQIEKILIGDEVILADDAGISDGVHNFNSSSVYYDDENIIEVRQAGEEFITDNFNTKIIVTNDGAELKHDYGAPTDPTDPDANGGIPLIRDLPDYTKEIEVCIQFNGLRQYDSDASNWKTRTATVRPYWSNNGGETWNEFYFDGMTDNTITLNKNSYIRFTAKKTFSPSDVMSVSSSGKITYKNILLKVVKTTPKAESNSNEDCYLLYYQSKNFDAKKSSISGLVDCKMIEDTLTNKLTRIAIRLKATENTTNQLDDIHVITSAKASTYNGTTWSASKTATSNPAAEIREILTSNKHTFSQFDADEIDEESLGELYEYCENNGFSCNAIITSAIKKSDIIDKILKTCNASMIYNYRTGKLEFVIDSIEELPVALINSENIKNATYTKELKRKVDGLKVTYTNGETWQTDTFYVMADGGEKTDDDAVTELVLDYVTDYEHAYKIAVRQLKTVLLQSKTFNIGVGKMGDYYPLYSTVLLQHKEFKQGIKSSNILNLIYDANNNIIGLKIKDPVKFQSGSRYGVIIQAVKPEGSRLIYKEVTGSGVTNELSIVGVPIREIDGVTPAPFNIISIGYLDANGEFSTVCEKMKITGLAPDGATGYTLTLKEYKEEIYTTGEIPPYKSNVTRAPRPQKEINDTATLADVLEAKTEAIREAASSVVGVQPAYSGKFDELPSVQDFNEGDFILLTTDGLTYTKKNGDWVADTGDTLTEHQARCITDLLAIADTLSQEPQFIRNLVATNVFLNNLFAKRIVIQDGGSIESENYTADSNGFKIDSNGDVEFNNGQFNGYLGKKLTLINNGSEYIHAPTYTTEGQYLHWELYAPINNNETYVGYLDIFEYSTETQFYSAATGKLFDLYEGTFFDVNYYSSDGERRLDTFKISYHSLYKDFSPAIQKTLYAYQTIGAK